MHFIFQLFSLKIYKWKVLLIWICSVQVNSNWVNIFWIYIGSFKWNPYQRSKTITRNGNAWHKTFFLHDFNWEFINFGASAKKLNFDRKDQKGQEGQEGQEGQKGNAPNAHVGHSTCMPLIEIWNFKCHKIILSIIHQFNKKNPWSHVNLYCLLRTIWLQILWLERR